MTCDVQGSLCCSASPQIVCVPYDWRITLVIIVILNASVTFILEVRSLDILPSSSLGDLSLIYLVILLTFLRHSY